MMIEKIYLQNFRSYSQKEFAFSPHLNLIVGQNTKGKTNLLEAIFSLAHGGSFRTEIDREMIEFGKELGRIKGIVYSLGNRLTGEKREWTLEMVITPGKIMGKKVPVKKYLVNGLGKRMIDFLGILKVVLFWPEDLALVTDSPVKRRRYLDSVLSQVDKEYRRCLFSYEKGLRQRNKVLEAIRDRRAYRQQLIFWDQLLVKTGYYLTRKREEYINYINSLSLPNFSYFFRQYQLIYDKSVISQARLQQYTEEEIAAAMTLVGPHRDDVRFQIFNPKSKEKKDVSHFGSRSEQRLAILWLKLGELSYIEQATKEKPVLLLDDIFSEFDQENRNFILEIINGQQTILTTTDLEIVEGKSLKEFKVIRL